MNIPAILSVAPKLIASLNAIMTDLGPELSTLNADISADVTAITKTVTDLQPQIQKLVSDVTAAWKA